MAKITVLKSIRKHFAKDGKILETMPKQVRMCRVCHKAMAVADGSTQLFHGACRKEGRKIMRSKLPQPKYATS